MQMEKLEQLKKTVVGLKVMSEYSMDVSNPKCVL